jgi:hypothetical protein
VLYLGKDLYVPLYDRRENSYLPWLLSQLAIQAASRDKYNANECLCAEGHSLQGEQHLGEKSFDAIFGYTSGLSPLRHSPETHQRRFGYLTSVDRVLLRLKKVNVKK